MLELASKLELRSGSGLVSAVLFGSGLVSARLRKVVLINLAG